MGRNRWAGLFLWVMAIAAVAVSVALRAWRRPVEPVVRFESPQPVSLSLGKVEDFTLTADDGRTVRREDLLGEVWVAGFIFTRCAGPCLRIVGQMKQLDEQLPRTGVRLVCFSVDPEYDTPEVLTRYRDLLKLPSDRWSFLTGDREPLYDLIRNSFHLAVEPATGAVVAGEEVTHSTRLVVVDGRGDIRGYFEADEQPQIEQLRSMVHDLLEEPQ